MDKADSRENLCRYPVAERFVSINGEGRRAGTFAAFIRMRGCNLSCVYCDTAWANEKDCPAERLSAAEILAWVRECGAKNVTLTGGEPLLVREIDALIDGLGGAGYSVEIETNGSVPLRPYAALAHRPVLTVDYKCPDSGMEEAMYLENFSDPDLLRRPDSVKFVVSSLRDLERAREITDRYRLGGRCYVYLSPVFGQIDPRDIVSYMEAHRWNGAALQLQLHKFIWPPDARGV